MKTKEMKRKEAEARQVRYNSLSLEQKLEQINARRGSSKKEFLRLVGG